MNENQFTAPAHHFKQQAAAGDLAQQYSKNADRLLNQQYGAMPLQVPALLHDSGKNADRLLEIHSRLCRIADQILGPAPTPIQQGEMGKLVGAPIDPTIRRNVDTARNWIDHIEGVLTRLESGL